MRNLNLVLLTGMINLFLNCSIGGSSESTGKIYGTVNYQNVRVSGVKVNLIDPQSKDTLDSVYTDTTGYFSFEAVTDNKYYSLQGLKDTLCFVKNNILPDTNLTIQLERTGTIHCSVRLAYDSDDTTLEEIKVFISGTSLIGSTDKNGEANIFYVPPGEYEIVISKDFYIQERVKVTVLPNRTTATEAITLHINPKADPLPPKNMNVAYDTLSGIVTVTWDSVSGHICQYSLHINDPSKFNDVEDGEISTLYEPRFIDTLFLESSDKTSFLNRTLKFRIKSVDIETGFKSSFTPFVTSVFQHPSTPPDPLCSLSIVDSCMIVGVHGSILPAEWIDSVFVYCSINDQDSFVMHVAIAAKKLNSIINDTIRIFPNVTDSLISVFYYTKAKSCFGDFSSPSEIQKTSLKNPYLFYSIPKPSRPEGPPENAMAASYNFSFSSVISPVKNDIVEYRLRLINTATDSIYFTAWYSVPSIDLLVDKEGIYLIQSQARSRLLPDLQSEYSDTLSITVYINHTAGKPPVPQGNTFVNVSNIGSYISRNISECSLGHTVSIRYAVSYQNPISPDTTNWIYPPDRETTIVWASAGTAYIRAQTRCITDTTILSPWSDALVVTVK